MKFQKHTKNGGRGGSSTTHIMSVEDDPFACFGDDDDDDDGNCDGDDEAARARVREIMLATSNVVIQPANTGAAANANTMSTFHSYYEDQAERTAALPWPDVPPLYLGPMKLTDTLDEEGGGRGYVALEDLPPGTLVLVEEPLVVGWSDSQLGRRLGLESIRYILEQNDAAHIVKCIEKLHPQRERVNYVLLCGDATHLPTKKKKSRECSKSLLDEVQILNMISELKQDKQNVNMAQSLVKYATEHSIMNSDKSVITENDIYRMLLTLQYNGFDSGLYLHFCIFNHSEDPNCIKFRPTDDLMDGTKSRYSEARTTRFVRKGDALTLHYIENPREVSHVKRRRILWEQHRFDIGDENEYGKFLDANTIKTGHLFNDNERGKYIFESELIHGKFPPSTREMKKKGLKEDMTDDPDDEDRNYAPTTSNIERSLDELEYILIDLRGNFEGLSLSSSSFDQLAALELTIVELIFASKSALGNDYHILLSRCYRLHLDVNELLMIHCSTKLTKKQLAELIARSLPSIVSLLHSRRLRLGNDHPDVARTYHDLAMGIRALLTNSSRILLSLKLDGMLTLDDCSRMEHKCRSERDRIDRLYPRDVDDILESVRRK